MWSITSPDPAAPPSFTVTVLVAFPLRSSVAVNPDSSSSSATAFNQARVFLMNSSLVSFPVSRWLSP